MTNSFLLKEIRLSDTVLGVFALATLRGVSKIPIRTFYRAFAHTVDARKNMLPIVCFRTDGFNPYSKHLNDALNAHIGISIDITIHGCLVMKLDSAHRTIDWLREKYGQATINAFEPIVYAFIEGLTVPDALLLAS